jgi:hypothetical protein
LRRTAWSLYGKNMIDTEFKVRRYIAEFSQETEELIAEYDLCYFELKQFQTEFCEPNSDNPMFDSYPIKECNVKFLKKHLAKEPEWDFVNKSYFVEAHAI